MATTATFGQVATLATIDRSTSGSVRFCAIETIAFGKSQDFTFLYYGFLEWCATKVRRLRITVLPLWEVRFRVTTTAQG